MVNMMTKYDAFKSRTKTYETLLSRLKRDTEDKSIQLGCGNIYLDDKSIHVPYSYVPIGLPDEILKAYIHADRLLKEFLQEIINTNNEKLLAIETILNEKLLAIETILSEGEPDA